MSDPPASISRQKLARTHVLLPHAEQPRMLLVPEAEGWSLPYCESEQPFWGRVGPLLQALRERLDAEVSVRRCVPSGDGGNVYLLENRDPDWTPRDGRWVGRAELPDLRLAVPAHRELLDRWLAEAEHGVLPANRNPWERPGWLAEAGEWIGQQLACLGIAARGPVELYRTTSISCLVTVATNEGTLFMKAALPIFAAEAPLIRALGARFTGRVPQVLALDADRHWMLMREVHGQSLFDATGIEPWEPAVRLIADSGAGARADGPALALCLAAQPGTAPRGGREHGTGPRVAGGVAAGAGSGGSSRLRLAVSVAALQG